MTDIGIIGCGNMGAAIAKQLRNNEEFTVHLYDADAAKLAQVCEELSVASESMDSLLSSCEITLLAVKPQILPSLFPLLSKQTEMKWISIAAGVSLATLSEGLKSSQVVRFMPNMAAAIGSSVTAMCATGDCSDAFKAEAAAVASSFGSVHPIEEKLMSAFTGISGSGIAYLFAAYHHMAMGGVHQGIPYATSLAIVAETAASAAGMLNHTGEHPQSMITKVCSPGGTTIEAMKTLEEEGFGSSVMNAVIAATQKAQELEKQAEKREEKK